MVPSAPVGEGTDRTLGSDGLADYLAELDEDLVKRQPVFLVYYPSKLPLCLVGCIGLDCADTVEDSVDVSINWYRGPFESIYENTVGCLPSDRWQFQQLVHILWNLPIIFFQNYLGNPFDRLCLSLVESYRPDEPCECSCVRCRTLLPAGIFCEESGRSSCRDRVLCPVGEDRGYQDSERIPVCRVAYLL